jgi:hypothetical protein
VLRAAGADSLLFDPFSLCQDGWPASEVNVGRGEIADARARGGGCRVVDVGGDPASRSGGSE